VRNCYPILQYNELSVNKLGIRRLKGRSRILTATGNSQQRGVPGRQQELAPTKNFEIPNPNKSECVARVVYPPPLADHKGSALHFLLKWSKYFL